MNVRKAIATITAVLANLGVLALPAGAQADTPCPNEVFREEQHATALPECRAFEQVSPQDKNGGDVAADNVSFTASLDGNAIAYLSRASFGDTVGSTAVGQTNYLARRGATGWSNHAVSPPPKYDSQPSSAGATLLTNYSDELNRVVVWSMDVPGTGAQSDTPNVYSEDTLTRDLQLVSDPLAGPQSPFLWFFSFGAPTPAGVSHDSRHIAFNAFAQLLPDAPPPGFARKVYQWDEGILRLASILPDGTFPPEGAELASPPDSAPAQGYRETVSPDGSRVLFRAAPTEGSPPQLYMRVDHTSTAWVSQSENPSFLEPAEEVVLQQVSGDSRHVIFDSTSPLLEEDENSGPDLYLYTDGPDPEHESNLTLITSTGDIPGIDPFAGTAVIGSSDDATRMYYYVNQHIFFWESGTTIEVADQVSSTFDENLRVAATYSAPGGARVTPDGRYLAFFVGAKLGGNLYLFDATQDSLRCVACSGNATIIPNATHIDPSIPTFGLRPRFLAPDGRVLFTTSDALVPDDTNGVGDVYEFDPATGGVALLSTGTSPTPSTFADASASGDDVFIATRQRLVASDRDTLVDLYDVRLDGGFPEPEPAPAPCSGESCRPGSSPAPSLPGLSSAQPGSGNPHYRRSCPVGKRHVRRGGKVRCVAKKHHRMRVQRHARTGLGGAR